MSKTPRRALILLAIIFATLAVATAGSVVLPRVLATPAVAGPSECPPGQQGECNLYHKVTPGTGCREAWFPKNANPQGWQPGPCPAPPTPPAVPPTATSELPTAVSTATGTPTDLPDPTNTPIATATNTPTDVPTATVPPGVTPTATLTPTPVVGVSTFQKVEKEAAQCPACPCSPCIGVQIVIQVDDEKDLELLRQVLDLLEERGYGPCVRAE